MGISRLRLWRPDSSRWPKCSILFRPYGREMLASYAGSGWCAYMLLCHSGQASIMDNLMGKWDTSETETAMSLRYYELK